MNEVPFHLSMAAMLAASDWLLAIEPMRARQMWQVLRGTDSRNHVSKTAQLLAGMPEADRANREEYLDALNCGDTGGMGPRMFGTNLDGSRKPYPVDDGVALLAVTGMMTKGDSWYYDGTSTARARRVVRQAKADGDVKAALIRFDTPGGNVAGNDDFAMDVADLARTKPTYAYCEDCCASAGYYVASQCNAVYANPSALIGSIASMMTIMDYSKMFEEAGIHVEVLAPDDAPFKGTGSPGTPITDDQKAYLKGLVVDSATMFRNAVKRGRGMTDREIAAVWDGRVFPATKARSLKLIDGITTYDNVLTALKRIRG